MYCQDTIAVKEEPHLRTAITLRCRAWTCPECSELRHKQLVAEAIGGKPRLFITLTSKRTEGGNPDLAAKALARAWRILRLRIMRKYRWKKLPFICVFEATKLGWPHLHILARCGYIDTRWVAEQMQGITGAPINKIVLIKNAHQGAVYCAKYCGKDSHRFGKCKRYWQSQDYDLRPPRPEHEDHAPGVQWERRIEGMYQWALKEKQQGRFVCALSPTKSVSVPWTKGSITTRASRTALLPEPPPASGARPRSYGPQGGAAP